MVPRSSTQAENARDGGGLVPERDAPGLVRDQDAVGGRLHRGSGWWRVPFARAGRTLPQQHSSGIRAYAPALPRPIHGVWFTVGPSGIPKMMVSHSGTSGIRKRRRRVVGITHRRLFSTRRSAVGIARRRDEARPATPASGTRRSAGSVANGDLYVARFLCWRLQRVGFASRGERRLGAVSISLITVWHRPSCCPRHSSAAEPSSRSRLRVSVPVAGAIKARSRLRSAPPSQTRRWRCLLALRRCSRSLHDRHPSCESFS